MSASVVIPIATTPRNRSIAVRRAARAEKARRERRIVDLLNCGVSVVEIAARVGVTEKRMRALIKEILARRMPGAPAEYAALQVGRLNEALLVAYSAMSGANLRAVECVVKIVRELDRYHGFVAPDRRAVRDGRSIEPKANGLPALLADRPETAPQRTGDSPPAVTLAPSAATLSRGAFLPTPEQDPRAHDASRTDPLRAEPQDPEKAELAPVDGMASAVSGEGAGPRLAGPAHDAPELPRRPAPWSDRLETAPQDVEKAEIAPGSGADLPHEALPPRAGEVEDDRAPAAPETNRSEMERQEAERMESAPASGGASDAADETLSSRLASPPQEPDSPAANLTHCMKTGPQEPEKTEAPPGDGSNAAPPEPRGAMFEGSDDFAPSDERPAQGASLAPAPSRIEIAPQPPEIAELASQNSVVAGPAIVGPGGFRILHVRMLQNGMAAC